MAGFIAQQSRQATTAVAGYDLTFSPVKSVSTLWALAPREVACVIEDAHDAAVRDTLAWLEREVAFTRLGAGGVRQVPVTGLVAAGFTHRDSRAGDPDLHTHLAVSNKVQTLEGRWLALDGRILFKAKVAASERYNTRLEAELVDRLGVRFADRVTAREMRPVREIVGVDPLLARFWSSRRTAIEQRRAILATTFQKDHGRPPTAVEAIALAQQANLETRDAKHPPQSAEEQRARWRQQASDILGGDRDVDAMVTRALARRPTSRTALDITATARQVITTLEANRATWQVWHVTAEAERQARAAGVPLALLDRTVAAVVDHALTHGSVRLGSPDPITEPASLRTREGRSVYDVKGATPYTSARVLDAERRLLAHAHTDGGRALSKVRVGIALAEAAANGTTLNDAQAAMVSTLATSGRRLQLALAPAGTGKTTAMGVLARAWTASDGDVLGLAPSAQAAHELAGAVHAPTDTLTKLTWSLTRAPVEQWPDWMRRIGPRTLVILDEAGQAGTTELATAVDFLTRRGASIRLIGDDQQLASVAAGGILRDIVHTVGAVTLSEVRRFAGSAEAAATLAVRDGDATALGFYADHRRIHVGDLAAVTDHAYAAWATDRAAGLDSLLLAPTRTLVAQLNHRARHDRLTGTDPGAEVRLSDGNHASVGDLVITRRNARRLTLTPTQWVKNGDRWAITGVCPDGSLVVRHQQLARSLTLPNTYVAEHVELGYATTVHGAQGITVDSCHTVVTGEETRQLLYVALSRGRTANHLYLANAHDGDPHSLIRPETLNPPTAIDVLTTVLGRDGTQHSATTTRRDADSPARLLHAAALRYADALDFATEHHLGNDTLTTLDQQLEALHPGLTTQPAYPTLRGHLALCAVDGQDPLTLVLDAAASREVDTADDLAAVLAWRLDPASHSGPLPWLPAIPNGLATDPDWGSYLHDRATRVHALAAQVRAAAHAWTPTQAPMWARHLTGDNHADLRGDLAVWRAAYDVPDTDHRPTGPPQLGTQAQRLQRDLDRRARAATTDNQVTRRYTLPDTVHQDHGHGRLLERLDELDRAGVDVPALLDQALDTVRPLPHDVPADALWWRIAGHLGPAALRTTSPGPDPLRPPWVDVVSVALGADTAQRVMEDPAWPALVAAISHAPAEWTPEALLTTAATPAGGPALPDADLCEALVWRIAILTDPPPHPDDEPTDSPTYEPPVPALVEPRPAPTPAPGSAITVERIVELNQQALDYYTSLYPRSWAPAYLIERLGTDLSDLPQHPVGYASPGPTSLLRHLTALGATEAELLEAGLARATDRGAIIDAFRDRLVFPIHDGGHVAGFIGRRNPHRDHDGHAGPKYLNTRTTPAFTKGRLLYGLTEGAAALSEGATPVLVEGPLDALAITLADDGHAVGIAPLGTAFTQEQAQQLRRYFRNDPSHIIVATDGDTAGWLSAQRANWRLTQYGANPHHLHLDEGHDPASTLNTGGPEKLAHALRHTTPLAHALLDQAIASTGGAPAPTAERLRLIRECGQIIGALPPSMWATEISRIHAAVELSSGMLHLEVADAGGAWTEDPSTLADLRIAEINSAQRVAHPGWRYDVPDSLRAPSTAAAQGQQARAGHPTSRSALPSHLILRRPGGSSLGR